MENRVLRAAINLALTGRKDESRLLLAKILEEDADNETAFFWFVDTQPTDNDRLQVLQAYLSRHPNSEKAQMALGAIEARSRAEESAREPHPDPLHFIERESDSFQDNESKAIDLPPPHEIERVAGGEVSDLSRTQPIRIHPIPVLQESYSTKAHRQMQERGVKKQSPLSIILIVMSVVLILMVCGGYWLYQLFTTNPIFLSEGQNYAREMDPVLVRISDWQNGSLTEWEKAMAEPVYEGQTATYGELFQLSQKMGSPNILLTRKLSPIAGKISLIGYQIDTQMSTVSPPAQISEAHQQVLICIRYTTEWATMINAFLQSSLPVPEKENPCSWYQDAYQQVNDYVNTNK